MAITTTAITKSAGWARTDIIYQLEEAFTWLGWNGDAKVGIVTGISSRTGGGTVGSSSDDYYDVFQSSSSGIGTGASFRVDRSGGSISAVYVNRPGYGYTDGEVVTVSADDIGGSSNGATNLQITVQVAGGGSPISYGGTTEFYDKDVTAGASYPWGVLRHTIQSDKKFGDTYRIYQALSHTSLGINVCSGFHPWNTTNYTNNGNGYANRLCGDKDLETSNKIPVSSIETSYSSSQNNVSGNYVSQNSYSGSTIAYSNTYDLDLNIFRSSIDPNFAVLSYKHPSLSSTKLRDNTFLTFFVHNFTSTIWDLDYVFLGGYTEIRPSTSDSNPYLEFKTYSNGSSNTLNSYYPSKRCAEFGYSNYDGLSITNKTCRYYSTSAFQNISESTNPTTIYTMNGSSTRGVGGYGNEISLPDFNAVIKGIPINTSMIPCPYYIPDDFVLIDFSYSTPSANIQQGDTITISGSEVYTVITGSYNTSTSGILFCARTV